MLKRIRWVNVWILAIITLLMLMPSASGYWWPKTPPDITDHSVRLDASSDVRLDLYIKNAALQYYNKIDVTGESDPPGQQVQDQPGNVFVWTCWYFIGAWHTGPGTPDWLQACEVRVYLHYYWCPANLDGSQSSNYQLLHSNWVQLTAFYYEQYEEEGMLHGVHQNHDNVPGEHYCAELSWRIQYNNNGSWIVVYEDYQLFYYEII